MNAGAVAKIAFWLLLALQPLWHGWWLPPQRMPAWAAVAIAVLPLLPPAVALLRRRPAATFWAALVSLLYFAHGIAEAWSDPAARLPASIQVLLSLLLVCAVGWAGLQRRREARRAASSADAGR